MTTKNTYGMHDPGGEHLYPSEIRGWIVFTEAVGHDVNDKSGLDYAKWVDQGFTPIVRLNNGYHPNGTLPIPEHYPAFAQRCANFVRASRGARIWIIGNEPNHEIERPNGQVITYEAYVLCYTLCREFIHNVPGHENDEVCVAAIAPWNTQTGDWLAYFEETLLLALEDGGVDAIALHAYTHGADPALIWSEQVMDPPYSDRYYHFLHYRQFMARIPPELKNIPVYITETNQGDAWLDAHSNWVQNAYHEVNNWNKTRHQQIRCLCLYRWSHDKWAIKDKPKVIDDFQQAMRFNYTWGGEETTMYVYDGFETGFYDYEGIGELTVPNKWVPRWDSTLTRPEYDQKYRTPEVRTGDYSANFFHVHTTFDAVLRREVNVGKNVKVSLSAWAMGVSHEGDGSPGGLGMQVGIGPGGEADHLSPNIQWGDWIAIRPDEQVEREWYKLTANAISQATTITIFLRGKADYAVDISATHWDDVVMEAEPGTTPPPTNGTLQKHIDSVQKALDDLQDYVNTNTISALPV